MSQNDYVIANQSAPDFRSDLNDALQALASLSSGSTAPSSTYANMFWHDTGNNILKMRTEADDAWINIAYLDQSANAFRILDDTQVVNTSGTQTGLLGDQTTATWEAGTSTTESLVSPAKVKAAVFPSENLSLVGHLTLGSIKIQWGKVSVTGSENQDFSVNFDTSFSSAPWSIVTTIEADSGTSFDLFEAYIRSSTTSGFIGRIGSTAIATYSGVSVNYVAFGPN